MKVNQHAQHSNGSSRFLLIYNVYLQIHSVFESKSTCTTFKWLFKVHALLQCVSSNTLLFFKVNQHAQQSNGYSRFMLFYYVYLQVYFVFESKSTFTTFKRHISLLKVNQHAQHSNGSSRFLLIDNVYLQIHSVFESKSTCTTLKWLFKVHALLQCVSSNTLFILK